MPKRATSRSRYDTNANTWGLYDYRHADSLTVNPRFYDALSAEFTPSIAKPARQTLGRLAYTAYTQGKEITHPDLPLLHTLIAERAYTLTPQWAPHSSITALGIRRDRTHSLMGIQLHHNERTLTAYYDYPDNEPGVLLIVGANEPQQFPITLEADLDSARMAVADAALRFYEYSDR